MLTVAEAKKLEELCYDPRTSDNFGGVLEVANHAISLFLARASGEVEEDVRMVRAVIDRYRDFGEVESKALRRLSALAQDTAQSRAATAEARQEVTDLRERLSRQSARAQEYLDETERLKSETHKLVSEKGEVTREADALRAKLEEMTREKEIAETRLEEAREDVSALRVRIESETHSLRAKVAELEKTQRGAFCLEQAKRREAAEDERDAIRAEVERLKAMVATRNSLLRHKQEDLTKAESRLAAIRAELGAHDEEAGPDLLATLEGIRAALEGDAPNSPGSPEGSAPGPTPHRHEDLQRLTGALDSADPANPDDGEPTKEEWEAAASLQDAYDRGAEAMRAACLAEAMNWAKEHGFIHGGEALETLKRRIEGVTP